MNLNKVEGEVTPILPAKGYLGSVGNLYNLARNSSLEARTQLAQEICSILEADITVRESEMVADVLIELLTEAEKNVRKALALKLSLLEHAPLRLILELANDEIDVAWPVLSASPALSDFDLMYIVKSQGPEYWKAIATRKALGDKVVEMLAGTKDVETALTLLENKDIVLNEHTMVLLSDLAQEEVVAVPLLSRDEMSNDLATTLYQFVGDEVKRYIAENYEPTEDGVVDCLEKVVEETVKEAVNETATSSKNSLEDTMLESAQAAQVKGILNVKMMIGTLRRGQMRSFVAQLSTYTGIKSEVITGILKQSNGQGLALIAKAYDVSKQDFISLFMLTGKLWKDGQFVHPDDVRKALKYYEKASREFALEFIQPQVKH